MKKILVPVDFSAPSENALKVASNLAKRNDAQLCVLHVIELAETLFGSEQFNVDDEQIVFFMKMAKKRFGKFMDKDFLKGVDYKDMVDIGPTSKYISEYARKEDVDMIVMGSTGVSGLEEVLIGSNTEKIVRTSSVPVLVVKKKMDDLAIKQVVFASDFDLESLKAYENAKQFADSFNAQLKLLYVNLPGNQFYSTQEIHDRMREFLHEAEVELNESNVVIYNDYTIQLGVINGSNSLKADLIAMPTHGRQGLSHFFNGSIGEDVVNHSTLPVITFKI